MPTKNHDCDICGSANRTIIESLNFYTDNQPVCVCNNCGFVYVPERRSFEEIAAAWSEEIFTTADAPSAMDLFTATRPAIRARLIFILETIDQELGLKGKSLCDIGAGEGVFLDYAQRLKKEADLFGVEPSAINCQLMDQLGVRNFVGTIEEYINAPEAALNSFDIVTIMWTVEASHDCKLTLNAAWDLLKPGGHLVVGTGSRLLAPFKKPLQFYVNADPADTHCFRFSPNSLSNLMQVTGFNPVFTNRYIDNDVLCMIGQKTEKGKHIELVKDNAQEVMEFFDRWARDSQKYFAEWSDE